MLTLEKYLIISLQAAQVRKEERKKAEKEKLLQETDPDKTRKWEVSSKS